MSLLTPQNPIPCPNCDEIMEIGGVCPHCQYDDISDLKGESDEREEDSRLPDVWCEERQPG